MYYKISKEELSDLIKRNFIFNAIMMYSKGSIQDFNTALKLYLIGQSISFSDLNKGYNTLVEQKLKDYEKEEIPKDDS